MGMTDAERNIELLRQLAESRESNATLQRILERQSYQIERMNDQLERALRELAMLRRQLNKPPPNEPPPGIAAVPPGPVEVPPAESHQSGAQAAGRRDRRGHPRQLAHPGGEDPGQADDSPPARAL